MMANQRVSARPLHRFLLAWQVETGDSVELMAIGFDVDCDILRDLMGADYPCMIHIDAAEVLCRRFRLDPGDLWNARAAETIDLTWSVDRIEPSIAGTIRLMGS